VLCLRLAEQSTARADALAPFVERTRMKQAAPQALLVAD
jgi:hypothetical protein